MRANRRYLLRLVGAQLAALLITSSVVATVSIGVGHGGRFDRTGGSDGVGGIPFAGGPKSGDQLAVPYLVTIGLVIDDGELVIPHAMVVVMSFDGTVVATGETDDSGTFAMELPVISGLTVSLPMNGVNEVPIEAGVPVLIVVP